MRTEESGIGSFEEEREIEEMGSLRRGVRWKEEERGRRRRATAMRRDVMGDRMLVELWRGGGLVGIHGGEGRWK